MKTQDRTALELLQEEMQRKQQRNELSFEEYLELLQNDPRRVLRSISQLFYDMVKEYVHEEVDKYAEDKEFIGFVRYDCSKLFVEGADKPFFADTPFANRFMRQVGTLIHGIQQNRIYIYDGPSGCGKSTFLNNILRSFEAYTSTPQGQTFEILWNLDEAVISVADKEKTDPQRMLIPCPSRDYPIMIIPKHYRSRFLHHLLPRETDEQRKVRDYIFSEKEYEWLFMGEACIICKSIFSSLFDKFGSLQGVLQMLRVRFARFNRSVGEGITVFSPGDPLFWQPSGNLSIPRYLINPQVQEYLDQIFGVNVIRYSYSPLAKTNNGIYVLTDIKLNNRERLLELHNVLSEGVHKVGDIEESINSLFFALMNPEDKGVIAEAKMESFQGRIQYSNITYVIEPKTEVDIYRSIFGGSIEERFLPRVLDNFARIIIATRMNPTSGPLSEWIPDFKNYKRYCDEHGLLLRMELYSNNIPVWLAEDDRNKFKAEVRRAVIAEGQREGMKGFSGRDSIVLFSNFFSRYMTDGKLINMNDVVEFFKHGIPKADRDKNLPPKGFLDSLVDSYDYAVLNEMKEALYFYSRDQISRDILNYLEAINYEIGDKIECQYTHDEVEVTADFLALMATRLSGREMNITDAKKFASELQKKYVVVVASRGIDTTKTEFYQELFLAYIRNLKENVLQPFVANKNFREAIKAFGSEDFFTFDARIREYVTRMIENLVRTSGYSEQSAKEVCLYVLDNNLISKFAGPTELSKPEPKMGYRGVMG